ncbi:MAG: RDD family protein [Kangiella sp.]|nr:RDD family protein [Kangiella sp.]
MQTIDYSKYSYYELLQALDILDINRFPDNYQVLTAEISLREASGKTDVFDLKSQPFYAGFWRRTIAYLIDALLLTLLLMLIGIYLFDFFSSFGYYALFIGFVISASYFTVGYSNILRGQTIGKSLLDIRVTDQQGGYLSLGRAFLRYTVLDLPFYVSAIILFWVTPFSIIDFVITLLSSFVFIISSYLFIFNRPSRRMLHDYAVGTMVVNDSVEKQPTTPFWKWHYLAIIPLLLIVFSLSFSRHQHKQAVINQFDTLIPHLENETNHLVTSVSINVSPHPSMGGVKQKNLVMTIHSFDTDIELDKAAKQIADLIKEHPQTQLFQNVSIIISTGWNLGMARKLRSQTHRFSLK